MRQRKSIRTMNVFCILHHVRPRKAGTSCLLVETHCICKAVLSENWASRNDGSSSVMGRLTIDIIAPSMKSQSFRLDPDTRCKLFFAQNMGSTAWDRTKMPKMASSLKSLLVFEG